MYFLIICLPIPILAVLSTHIFLMFWPVFIQLFNRFYYSLSYSTSNRGPITLFFYYYLLLPYLIQLLIYSFCSWSFVFLTIIFILSLIAVLQIADQLINRVNTLHEKSIIHRDIKPVRTIIPFLCSILVPGMRTGMKSS